MDRAELIKEFIQYLREYRATLDAKSDSELQTLVMIHFKSVVLPPTREKIINRIMAMLCEDAARQINEEDRE